VCQSGSVYLKQPVSRALPYRLYVAFLLCLATCVHLFVVQSSHTLILLLCCALIWPVCCWWCQRYDRPATALLLHLIECAVFSALAAGLTPLSGHALLLVLLAGPAAIGGWRFLLPCAFVLALCVVLTGFPAPAYIDVPGLVLLYGVILSLSLVSFQQALRLHGQRNLALDTSSHLNAVNAHLERYLPSPVRDNVRAAAGCRQPPDSRWVVVVFIDLVGFSAYVRHRTAAEIVDVVDAYQTVLDRLASAHGGVLGKFLGDGVLVYFPESDSRSTDAGRAMEMIAALPDLLQELNSGWRSRGQLVALQARVGVASGYCALGDWGSGRRLDYTLIGDAVNLASRLQAAAEPCEALVCEATAALLEPCDHWAGRVGPARRLCLKGFGEVVVHPLVDVNRPPL